MTSDDMIARIFHQARTVKEWHDRPVDEAVLRNLWHLAALGPTSFNCSPMRPCFVVSQQAKERLIPHLMDGNVPQVKQAPVTAILANDINFHERFPTLFPFMDLNPIFAGDDKIRLRESTAMRNGSLQGAYFIIAARALGLDCGPMSGFDNAGVDQTFFAHSSLKSNFLCNIGYGKRDGLHPRAPRLEFEEAAKIL